MEVFVMLGFFMFLFFFLFLLVARYLMLYIFVECFAL